MATHTVTKVIKYPIQHKPPITYTVSKDICPEHLVNMIETHQNGSRITTYCPACLRKQISEGLKGG